MCSSDLVCSSDLFTNIFLNYLHTFDEIIVVVHIIISLPSSSFKLDDFTGKDVYPGLFDPASV